MRGFLLTRDQTFLQPYRQANQQIDTEFATLFLLVKRDSEQTVRLKSLQTASQAWQQIARQTVSLPTPTSDLVPQMLERKRQMDGLRASAEDFLSAEAGIRTGRSITSVKVDTASLGGLIALAALLGILLAWDVYRLFRKLAGTYNRQLEEVTRRRDESFAREQWLNTTLRSIGDAVIACDPEGNVVFSLRFL
jgi:PAS domain-containing protein